MEQQAQVTIAGGGLAGCEAAWQLLRRGVGVRLYEMKPSVFSPAHSLPELAELVCSNSLKSVNLDTAHGLLKEELGRLDSLILQSAYATRVPAGQTLAVDRLAFARLVTEKLLQQPGFCLVREELTHLPTDHPIIMATGPLTSAALSQELLRLTAADALYFYDAIAPIIRGDSIDSHKVFAASRYNKGEADYLNCPMTESEYLAFVHELKNAATTTPHIAEDLKVFEGCMMVETLAQRGDLTLAHGPMRPVGLISPLTGKRPFAVIQLRQEDDYRGLYNIVGFQTRLKQGEQQRVFRMIPGLEQAKFVRYGSAHRNTFVNAPKVLTPTLQLRDFPNIFLAGQITGVEGYLESTAMGLIAALSLGRFLENQPMPLPTPRTAMGALIHYLSHGNPKSFQPMNINFGIITEPPSQIHKKERRAYLVETARQDFGAWLMDLGLDKSLTNG
jgi:methylenetetrahydrofolate--tRNA-(uracil-5-)-methyltransferase